MATEEPRKVKFAEDDAAPSNTAAGAGADAADADEDGQEVRRTHSLSGQHFSVAQPCN